MSCVGKSLLPFFITLIQLKAIFQPICFAPPRKHEIRTANYRSVLYIRKQFKEGILIEGISMNTEKRAVRIKEWQTGSQKTACPKTGSPEQWFNFSSVYSIAQVQAKFDLQTV